MGDAEGVQLADSVVLWRRVPPNEQIPPESPGDAVNPKGSAFRTKGTEDGVSVGLAAAFAAAQKGPRDLLALADADETWGVLEITVGEIRANGLDVEVDPKDPFHALIKPPPSGGKSRHLSKNVARWILKPRGP